MSNCVKPAFANYKASIVAFKISNSSFFSTYATVNMYMILSMFGNKNVSI